MEEIKTSEIINEKLYIKTLPDGLKCYIIPKSDFIEKQAVLVVNFGSVNDSFIRGSDDETIVLPDGCAHFLEHKMFEKPDYNALLSFNALGGEVNAFTSHTATGYYFSSIDNFYTCLDALFNLVYEPYFTEENVRKEMGIIQQEISMYEDDPGNRVLLNLLDCLYVDSPIKKNIAGSWDSISKVDESVLYTCHKAFYIPDNMALICVGDFSKSEIYEIAKKHEKKSTNTRKLFVNEKTNINKSQSYVNMDVSMPLFAVGFKDVSKNVSYETEMEIKLLLDILFGESSEFFTALYKEGNLDNYFGSDFLGSQRDCLSILSGRSNNPEKVAEKVLSTVHKAKNGELSDKRIDLIKKKHMGQFMRRFNSIDAIAISSAQYFPMDTDILQVFDHYNNVTAEQIHNRLIEHFNEERFALSVVKKI